MRQLILLAFLVSLSNCSHGLNVAVCLPNPSEGLFKCSTKKDKVSTVTFANSSGYAGYSALSYQNLLNYCADREVSGVPIPKFDSCISSPSSGGFNCKVQTCKMNSELNGIDCIGSAPFTVPYSATNNFISLSPSDNDTVLAFCNISIEDNQP